MTNEELKPWERLPEETPKQAAAFRAYLQAGPRRSIAALAGASRRRWEEWSRKNRWAERAHAWDDWLFFLEIEAAERERQRLALNRASREVQLQQPMSDLADELQGYLKKWAALPPTDVVVQKQTTDPATGQTTSTVQKVRGYRGVDLARMIEAWLKLNATTVHGFIRISRSERVESDDKQQGSGGSGRLELILDEWPDGSKTEDLPEMLEK